MKFIRVHGRVIPIGAAKPKHEDHSVKQAAAGGSVVGGAYNIRRDAVATAKESAIKNSARIKEFHSKLKVGDIIVTGSTPHTSGWHTFQDGLDAIKHDKTREAVAKTGKFFGFKKNHQITPALSSTLAALGVGKKSHAAMYVGNGKVVHAYPSEGVFKDSLEHALTGSDATAYRFENASGRETANAVRYAKAAVKNKVQYQKLPKASKNLLTNLGVPFLNKKTVGKERFSSAVCHTVPIRAYGNREFAQGEHTFAGDFKFTKGLKAVARRDIGKGPSVLNYIGQSLKGLKWGVAAAGVVAAHQAIKKFRKSREK
jgi:ribosomal protein L35AE/L33A